MSDPAVEQWIERARAVKVDGELRRRGLWSKAMAGDNGVPCPGCGGRDRFAVSRRKNVWICRAAGLGGDAIALAMHIDGTDFLAAVETVTGEPCPRGSALGPAERAAQEREIAARRAEHERREIERRRSDEVSAARFREAERRAAHEIWRRSLALAGTAAEGYLRLRRLEAPAGARLRFAPDEAYWSKSPEHGGTVLWRGSALVAAIEAPQGRFGGVERTWIDLAQPKGKALILDPETGEILPPKKVRGSQKGGSILLRPGCAAAEFPGDRKPLRRMFLGEGSETVLAVYCALVEAGSPMLESAEFRASVSLGNLAGRAAGRIRHPTLTKLDKNRHERPVFVPGPEPANDDHPLIPVPDTVEDLILLGDGDSEPFFTRCALERAARRYVRPGLTVRLAMAREGFDFDDMWRAA